MNDDIVKAAKFTGRLARESLKLGWRVTAILAGVAGGAAVNMVRSMPAVEEDEQVDYQPEFAGEVFDFPSEHAGAYDYAATAEGGSPSYLR